MDPLGLWACEDVGAVVFMVDSKGASGQGHAAMIIINPGGDGILWELTAQSGKKWYDVFGESPQIIKGIPLSKEIITNQDSVWLEVERIYDKTLYIDVKDSRISAMNATAKYYEEKGGDYTS